MRKLIMMIVITIPISFCWSQSYFLQINKNDGSKGIYNCTEIKKLTFQCQTDLNIGNNDGAIIRTMKLVQNYPNPFNPLTTIEYELPKSGKVQLVIYDVQGKLVRDILNLFQNQGKYYVEWDGTNSQNIKMSSGIYIYQLKYENTLLSKKMLLVK